MSIMSKNKSSANTAKNILVKSVCTALLVAATSQIAFAKAYFATLKEMVERSDAIAIVDLSKVKNTATKGKTWTYSKEAQATLIETLKGKLPKTFVLCGGENFRCAHVDFKEGKNLLFLNKEGDYYRGANWMNSCISVDNNKLPWFETKDERHYKATHIVKLEQAQKDINALLGGKSMGLELPEYLITLLKADQFTDQVIGEAPAQSPQWKAYEKARLESTKIQSELQYIALNGTPAGKLYAACALMSSDKKQGTDLLNSWKEQKVEVFYRSGCRATNASLGEIATKLLQDGKFLNFSLKK